MLDLTSLSQHIVCVQLHPCLNNVALICTDSLDKIWLSYWPSWVFAISVRSIVSGVFTKQNKNQAEVWSFYGLLVCPSVEKSEDNFLPEIIGHLRLFRSHVRCHVERNVGCNVRLRCHIGCHVEFRVGCHVGCYVKFYVGYHVRYMSDVMLSCQMSCQESCQMLAEFFVCFIFQFHLFT